MDNINIVIANILGVIAAISYVYSLSKKSKSKVISSLLIFSIICVVQYIILGSLFGIVSSGMSLIVTLLYNDKLKLDKKKLTIITIFIAAIHCYLGYITQGDTLFDKVMTLYIIIRYLSIMVFSVQGMRLASAIDYCLWTIYDFRLCSYVTCVVDLVTALSLLLVFIQTLIIDVNKWRKGIKD